MSIRSASSLFGLLVLWFLIQPVAANETTRSVMVTGTSVAKVKPDIVVWNIKVTSTDPDLTAAREANDRSTASVLALREELGISADDVQTGNLRIQKVHERDRSGNQGAFRHFSFQRTIILRQRDVTQFDEVLQNLTATENLTVSYSLSSSDFHEVRRKTRLRAVEVAKEKANEMTTLLGAKLGHVLTIDEKTPNSDPYRSSPMSNSMYVAGTPVEPDDVQGTFAPGSIEIRVSVNIQFAIE